MAGIDYDERIPNNVDLAENRRLQRALEDWQPKFLEWWQDMGPEGFQAKDVYLRTAISVDAKGWAQFGYVKMPEYRWGIFLAEPEPDRRINFGDHQGQPAWQEVPGEYRGDAPSAHRDPGRHRARLGRAAAPSRAARARRSTIFATSSRSTWRKAGTSGRWSTCSTPTSAATAARSRRRCSSAAPAITTSPASWAPSTRRRRTGSPSSCSASSPIATASTSSRASRRAASTRSPAPAASCSPRKPTTCSWARAGWGASCSGPAS